MTFAQENRIVRFSKSKCVILKVNCKKHWKRRSSCGTCLMPHCGLLHLWKEVLCYSLLCQSEDCWQSWWKNTFQLDVNWKLIVPLFASFMFFFFLPVQMFWGGIVAHTFLPLRADIRFLRDFPYILWEGSIHMPARVYILQHSCNST